MFSENQILAHCQNCKDNCSEIKQCPVKIHWAQARKRKVLPLPPVKWEFSGTGENPLERGHEQYSIEELISGLNKLSDHL